MNVLIVYTHPNHHSLCYDFLQKVMEGSKANERIKQIKVIDLYEEKFNPALAFNDQKRRRDMHKDPEMEEYRKQIVWADKLVFVYPIWWGRPPAMLLGYFDQVLASNFAYKDKGKYSAEGLLKGKTAVCVSTMKGPAFYPFFLLNNAHKALIKKATLNFVGISKVKFFEFGSMENSNGKHDQKLNKIYHYFSKIKK
ncbi:NAD(P)H dehydrogenase (quinone) [Gracilibacillus ureilyticus]|uniref:NAD(P)H dehydrogenase (Quinone) n=1 Tax=Gracilibacillus ureilyticus TaxID=531814 RepID=A0A1H9NCS4_9BACI|nr:NAD(P)H-dependent oxidoreductase [Gracilibacillus ureilyticus]SER33547.1 NAD(P)H dehydrogenase (quinone) [Gracilibacillus ureilyticus]